MVSDDEHLYRSVRNDPSMFQTSGETVRFSATCFNDRAMKTSVDRAILRDSPEQTKHSPSDGIIRLLALQVREIEPIPNGDGGARYVIDVHARPIPPGNSEGVPENRAHAQIEASPDFANASRFKKLKEALAQLAARGGWFIEPS